VKVPRPVAGDDLGHQFSVIRHASANYPRVALGIAVMSILVVAFNRLVWRPLYRLPERRFCVN
jgi:ABC-type anion transport system duplicated permease subunit